MFMFMAANYYVNMEEKVINLDIIRTGQLARGRRSCGNPYAEVFYENMEKKLVFPCDTDLTNARKIKVVLSKGIFGYVVVKNMRPIVLDE